VLKIAKIEYTVGVGSPRLQTQLNVQRGENDRNTTKKIQESQVWEKKDTKETLRFKAWKLIENINSKFQSSHSSSGGWVFRVNRLI
jgi:hypothetical protein